MAEPLRLLHAENYTIRREVVSRAERIDKLTVDRSRFAKMPLQRWSVEAEAHEPALQAMRADLTETDRFHARRAMFALAATMPAAKMKKRA